MKDHCEFCGGVAAGLTMGGAPTCGRGECPMVMQQRQTAPAPSLYVSTEDDPLGADTIERHCPYISGITYTVHVSHWIRERGAGAPIPTAGGQRDSLRVAGPFATHAAAVEALAGMVQ